MSIHEPVHASITSYANATMGSPPDKTMQQALDRDYFRYPGLTSQMYRRNPPHAIESSEGHMKQSRQNVRSTRPKDNEKNMRDYPFATSSPVADRLWINIHQQSVLADSNTLLDPIFSARKSKSSASTFLRSATTLMDSRDPYAN